MDELEFRRLLERFPIVRFRDYHIDSDASKHPNSQAIAQEEVKQWKEQWDKGHKQETEDQSMHRGGAFWGKVREAAEKKVLKEKLLALCTPGGVQYDPNEEILMAARNISERQAYSSAPGPSHRATASSTYAQPSSSMANRIAHIEEDLDHIRHLQAYQAKQNQTIAEMLRSMALHHGMNMEKFPTCPPYVPMRNKAVLDDDDDDDEDDEEEEEDEDDE